MQNIFIIGKITEQGTRLYFNTKYGFNQMWIENATEAEEMFSSKWDAQKEIESMSSNEKWLLFIEEFFTK